jgi:UDP-glucose 4-epimerase
MIKAAKSKIFNEIFNVGSQKSLKIEEIAKMFKGKKIYIPKRTGDPKHSSANINKIAKLLNWKPKISIKEGINILLKTANKQ